MIFLILLLVLVWVLPAEGNRICYQREQSQLLKFIASIVVVIGHQACYYDINNDLFMKETSLGALCVSFFLFMSGYGLLFGVLKIETDSVSRMVKQANVEVDSTCFDFDIFVCCCQIDSWSKG